MLTRLPKDLIYEIMKHLDAPDLNNFAQTNKYHTKLYSNENFWLRKVQFKLSKSDCQIPSYMTYRDFYSQLCQSGYLIHIQDQTPIAGNVVKIRPDSADGVFFVTAYGKLFYYRPANHGRCHRHKLILNLYSIGDKSGM